MIMLSPILGLYAFKIIPNWKAKQYFLSRHFRGENIDEFNARCHEFSTKVLPSLIRPKALNAIHAYHEQGATMAVVSARSEEHTSELRSLMSISYAVDGMKKKQIKTQIKNN